MSENHQSFVSPDKLSRPEQADLGYNAGVRISVVYAAVRNIATALQPVLSSAPTPVESVQQPTYEPTATTPQSYTQMSEYQVPTSTPPQQSQLYGEGATMDTYAQPSASTNDNDAYLDAIAPQPSDFEHGTGTNWQQPTLTGEQAQRLEDARQSLAGLHEEADNYNSAG